MTTTHDLTLVLIAMTASACAPVQRDTFALYDASPEEEAAIQSAADAWCEHGLCVEITRDPPDATETSTIRMVDDLQAWHALGLCSHAPDMVSHIAIARTGQIGTLTPAQIRAVALHEFGHHWGCRDSSDPGTVMAQAELVDDLTPADLACAGAQ